MIRTCFTERVITQVNDNDYPETYFKVEFRENGKTVAVQSYPGKSHYYVEEVKDNWRNGILKLETILNG
jgi:hypothetical protein